MRKAPTVTGKTLSGTNSVEYELFHSTRDYFHLAFDYGRGGTTKKETRKAFFQGQYKHVHTFERPAEPVRDQLEQIFHASQNLDEAWHPSSSCRSTSVGDIVKVNGTYWIVASIGFDRLWKE